MKKIKNINEETKTKNIIILITLIILKKRAARTKPLVAGSIRSSSYL